jgi:hypothetical protein
VSRLTGVLATLNRLPNPVKIIGGLSALVALILGVIRLYQTIFPPPKPAERSVLFIVDSSQAMRSPFRPGGVTKFEAVKSEILRYVRNQPDVVAGLRFVGNICTEGYQSPVVKFAAHDEEEIARALDDAQPTKIADLSGAVGQGANDFLRSSKAGKAKSPSMWLFFGRTRDPCGFSGLADEIATELQGVKVDARFDFFVFRKTAAGRKELDRLLSKLRKQGHTAMWSRPATPTQLHQAVQQVSRSENPSK